MNKKELIESISHLPSDCSRPRPMIDKSTTLELIKLLDEPQEVEIPMFVADWIEKCKSEKRRLHESLTYTPSGVNGWVSNPKNQETFARAWLDGYEVEKEKRYLVKVIGMSKLHECLNFDTTKNRWNFFDCDNTKTYRTHHTRKELEEAGFSWVFDCEGIEVKEVE